MGCEKDCVDVVPDAVRPATDGGVAGGKLYNSDTDD